MKKQEELTCKELNALWKIAQKTIYGFEGRKPFERRWNDEEDFPDIAIWSLEAAMTEAYRLGQKNATKALKDATKA